MGTINQNTTLHKAWKKVQKIAGKFSATLAPVLRDSDLAISQSHAEVASILVEAFTSVSGEHNYSNQFIQYKHNIDSTPISFDTATTFSYNDDFSMQELKHCLSLTTESTPGLDRITYLMLKHLHHNMTKVILYTFNRIYQDNIYPDRWKTAIIVPVLKPGKDPQDSSNYRPISLTSCLSKLLEKMMWYLCGTWRKVIISPAHSQVS